MPAFQITLPLVLTNKWEGETRFSSAGEMLALGPAARWQMFDELRALLPTL